MWMSHVKNDCFSEFSSRLPTPGWMQSISTSVKDLESDEFVGLKNICLSAENTDPWFPKAGLFYFFFSSNYMRHIKEKLQGEFSTLLHYFIIGFYFTFFFFFFLICNAFSPCDLIFWEFFEENQLGLILWTCINMFNNMHMGGHSFV